MARSPEAQPADAPVVCDSLAEADGLLEQLGLLNAAEAQAQSECSLAEEAARNRAKDRLFVEIDGCQVSFTDRRQHILAALEEFAEAERKSILRDGGKSLKLTHGEIGWRKSPDAIAAIEGQSEAGNATVLDKLTAHLRGALAKFAALCAPALACLTISVKWSRTSLKTAMQRKELKPAELRSIGFKFVEGDDKFFARPAEVRVSARSCEGAD